MSELLYNTKIKNSKSLYFNKKIYDEEFFGEQDCTIDVLVHEDDTISDSDTISLGEERNNIHTKKIKRINSYLSNIEPSLDSIRARIDVVSKQIDACRECCYYEHSVKSADPSLEVNGKYTGCLNFHFDLRVPDQGELVLLWETSPLCYVN